MIRRALLLWVFLVAFSSMGRADEPHLVLRGQAGAVPTFADARLEADHTGERVRFTDARGRSMRFSVKELHLSAAPAAAQHPPVGERPTQLPETAWASARAVTRTGDGRLGVAALTDGTIRWYAEGRELLALLPCGERWIAFTPSGYYAASMQGDDLAGFRVPRQGGGPDDFFPLGQMARHFYRPDMPGRVLLTRDEARALEESAAAARRPPATGPLRRMLPPLVTVLSPVDGAVVSKSPVTVEVVVRSPSGEPAAPRVQVSGRAAQIRGISMVVAAAAPAEEGVRHRLIVEVPATDTAITVAAETEFARSKATSVRLRWGGPQALPKVTPAPDLYVLAVGVGRYQLGAMRLDYPAKDAADLAAAFRAQEGRAYRRVVQRVLRDDQANRQGTLEGLSWLATHTRAKDVAVVFLAGHGATGEDGQYYFLPHDTDPDALVDTALSGGRLQEALARVPGHVLVFLDTCQSGGVLAGEKQRREGLRRFTGALSSEEGGVVVYAAATAAQGSRESVRWGNGAFTKAVIEGLSGEADSLRTGRVTVSGLSTYIGARVIELTEGQQTPTMGKPLVVPDLTLAQVNIRPPLHQRWWLWSAVGLAAAGLITGAILLARPKDPVTDAGSPIDVPLPSR